MTPKYPKTSCSSYFVMLLRRRNIHVHVTFEVRIEEDIRSKWNRQNANVGNAIEFCVWSLREPFL